MWWESSPFFSLAATGGLLYTDDETFYSFLDPEAVGSACSLKICDMRPCLPMCGVSVIIFFSSFSRLAGSDALNILPCEFSVALFFSVSLWKGYLLFCNTSSENLALWTNHTSSCGCRIFSFPPFFFLFLSLVLLDFRRRICRMHRFTDSPTLQHCLLMRAHRNVAVYIYLYGLKAK